MLSKVKFSGTSVFERFHSDIESELKGISIIAHHPKREKYLRFYSILNRFLPDKKVRVSELFLKNIAIEKLSSYMAKSFIRDYFNFDHLINGEFCQSVFVTARIGAYQLVNHYLMLEKGISICMVVSKEAKKTFEAEYYYPLQQAKDMYSLSGNLTLVDAEESNLIYTLKKFHQQGYSFLFYLDDCTPANNHELLNKNMEKVNFCNQELYVHKGMPFIAKLFNLPVVPLFMTFDSEFSPELVIGSSIAPSVFLSNQQFATDTIQEIWRSFEDLFKKQPQQWQGLNFANAFFAPETENTLLDFSPDDHLVFNQKRFQLLKSDSTYIFDLQFCKKLAINAELFSFFDRLIDSDIYLTIADFGESEGLPLRLLPFLIPL